MTKQIKIVLIVGAVVIAIFGGYHIYTWVSGEPEAQQRGVSLDNVEEPE